MTATVTVRPLLAGHVSAPHAYVYRAAGHPLRRLAAFARPEGPPVRMPLLAYLVIHPEHGPFVIDTGLHAEAHRDLRADLGTALGLLFRGIRPEGVPFDAQLRAAGVDPGEVRLGVMTHLHADHTSGMRLLPHAEWVLDAREWRAATARGAVRAGYATRHLPADSRVRALDLHRDGEPHEDFPHGHDLFGDGAVRLLATPGHTPGHLSVLLHTAEAPVLVAGDAAYTRRMIAEQRLPLLTDDDGDARRSLAALAAFTRRHPDAVVVPTHDPDAWRDLVAPGG